MKKETLTLIIGSLTTLLVLALVIFTMYKIDEKKSTPKDKTTIKEVDSNKNNINDDNTNSNNVDSDNKVDDNNNSNNTNDNNNSNTNNVKNKVTLYVFHGATCPACKTALERINANLVGKYNYLEIKTFEVWSNKDNSELMSKVADKLNVEANYIPFIVIDKYNRTGSTGDKDFLVDEIEKAHKNPHYEDVVEQVINENKDLNPKFEILKK